MAYKALSHTYGISSILSDSPRYALKRREGNKLVLSFDRIPLGITSFGNVLRNFEVAGSDGVFLPAEAKIVDREKVVLWNDDVKRAGTCKICFQGFCNRRFVWRKWDASIIFQN